MKTFVNTLRDELEELKSRGLHRSLRIIDGIQGPRVTVEGRRCLLFCSNNYLGLAGHPAVLKAASGAITRYGWGSGASRLISGSMRPHRELETKLASFKRREAAILFPSGYMANVGVVSALTGPGDLIVIDKLSHASIIDAARLSGARLRVYPHGNMNKLEAILAAAAAYRRRLVITDGIFSMDGDLAPLGEMTGLAKRYDAWIMVDEAHATGVLGEHGRGAAEFLGVEENIPLSMGTLSKALGGAGGFVTGPELLIDLLRNRARSFIYTTAPPPALCAAAIAAIEIVEREPDRRRRLLRNAELLREGLRALGLDTMESAFHIIPVIIGDARNAVNLSEKLFGKGILAPAIRPPTVPRGTSRLRLSVTTGHTEEDIYYLLDNLKGLTTCN